jgi:hypothetical protein
MRIAGKLETVRLSSMKKEQLKRIFIKVRFYVTVCCHWKFCFESSIKHQSPSFLSKEVVNIYGKRDWEERQRGHDVFWSVKQQRGQDFFGGPKFHLPGPVFPKILNRVQSTEYRDMVITFWNFWKSSNPLQNNNKGRHNIASTGCSKKAIPAWKTLVERLVNLFVV